MVHEAVQPRDRVRREDGVELEIGSADDARVDLDLDEQALVVARGQRLVDDERQHQLCVTQVLHLFVERVFQSGAEACHRQVLENLEDARTRRLGPAWGLVRAGPVGIAYVRIHLLQHARGAADAVRSFDEGDRVHVEQLVPRLAPVTEARLVGAEEPAQLEGARGAAQFDDLKPGAEAAIARRDGSRGR